MMNPGMIENRSYVPASQQSSNMGLTQSPHISKRTGRPSLTSAASASHQQCSRLRRLLNLDPADIDAAMEPEPAKGMKWWVRGEFGPAEESSSSPEKKAGGSDDASSLASLVDRVSQMDISDTSPKIDEYFRRVPDPYTTKTKSVKKHQLKTRSMATSSSKGDAKITDFFAKRSTSKK